MTAGYYRFPTIQGDSIVFVSEDDLWSVPVAGGIARRLTSNLGEVTYPMLSPDGELLAFVGREEGAAEVYVMPAAGGSARRLTYQSNLPRVVGWTADSKSIIFTSSYGQPHSSEMVLFTVDANSRNGDVTELPYGGARTISFGPGNRVVLGRNTGDPARWKRYRGGTAGHLWIDADGDGNFVRFLPNLQGNIASPIWLTNPTVAGDLGRVYFVSDHEGVGNLYSSKPDGSDLQRHTDHEDYYVRNPHSDGKRIVYHIGADLFVYDVATDSTQRVNVSYHSPRVQRNRKFVDAGRYLDTYSIHPSGQALAVTTRGKSYTFYNHEGPVVQYGKRDGVRYRHPTWLHDGQRLVLVTDEPGEETLEIYSGQVNKAPQRLEGLEIGRVVTIKASPLEDKIALTNHRYELLLIDLATRTVEVIDRSAFVNIAGFNWSPDGRWIAYGFASNSRTSEIRLYHLPDEEPTSAEESATSEGKAAHENGDAQNGNVNEHASDPDAAPVPMADAAVPSEVANSLGAQPLTTRGQRHVITRPVLHDVQPAFDPDGKYLYFLSYREFNPVHDGLHFDLGFPWGMRPYLITLRSDLPNPFIPVPDLAGDGGDEDDDADLEDDAPLDDAEEDDEDDYDEDEGDDGDDDDYEDDDDDADEDDDADHDEGDGDDDYDGDNYDDDDESGNIWHVAHRAKRPTRSASRTVVLRDAPEGKDEPEESARKGKKKKSAAEKEKADATKDEKQEGKKENKPKAMRLDLEGIEQRVIAFPVPDGRYGEIVGIPNKALFTTYAIQGQLDGGYEREDDGESAGTLRAYDFKDYRSETLVDNVSTFEVSANLKKLIYWGRGQLRVINAGEKAPGGGGSSRKTGWINLGRVKVSVHPQSEWEQMFREAWRLQRDHFWTEDMSEVDWQTVYHRYFALIPRVSTRGEFSDLMWEMQGELGTSHAYEFGGDYRSRPYYGQGFLGTEISWDAAAGGYRVGELVLGDPWDVSVNSPLAAPGVDVKPGDVIVAINGQPLDADTSPAQLLVNQAGHEVLLSLLPRPKGANGKKSAAQKVSSKILQDVHPNDEGISEEQAEKLDAEAVIPDAAPPMGGTQSAPSLRTTVVKTIGSEAPARYRNWVNENRRKVHAATDGRVGYVHVPDMGAEGYAEFHRGYLAEVDRDALIIDVRYNGGGNVSQLILEKLARRRLGYDQSRWGGLVPYPVESVAGPLVALTNEHAGSDGDIFCHSFKMLKLGPLVGKRTWGGVIGIAPHHALVDGTVTTQPEYSFWFEDVGWEVENYGTDPDIEVDITPQDYRNHVDPQLDRSIGEAMRLLESGTRKLPELATKPSRALPKLPPRTPSTADANAGG